MIHHLKGLKYKVYQRGRKYEDERVPELIKMKTSTLHNQCNLSLILSAIFLLGGDPLPSCLRDAHASFAPFLSVVAVYAQGLVGGHLRDALRLILWIAVLDVRLQLGVDERVHVEREGGSG